MATVIKGPWPKATVLRVMSEQLRLERLLQELKAAETKKKEAAR